MELKRLPPEGWGKKLQRAREGADLRGLSAQHVSDLVRGWMGSVNVAATAHALRHTCATDLLRSGVHLRDVQHALGHASLATTELYLPWVVARHRPLWTEKGPGTA